MSQYYTSKRTRGLYNPNDSQPFKLSRTKIELFLECPRCFYLDRRLGIGRPPGFPFTLNSAVDALLKKEFDIHRAGNKQHPLLKKYGIDAIPARHENLDKWRNNFHGVRYIHQPTNLCIFGAIDDLWQNSQQEYIVVDYKATSKDQEIISLDKEWHIGYKRQMEIYQWLLRKNGFKVSNTGYFVYCNGKTDKKAFDAKLEFDVTLIAHTGNDAWIEGIIKNIYQCLTSSIIPKASDNCDYCEYTKTVALTAK